MNHPLDCPICDQAGECLLQDYSYKYGSGDSRMVEPKRRYRYEDLGAKIAIDKNRCIHCTRCIRFTQEVSGTSELTVANRGAELEVTTYAGRSMDDNPLAGNVVDLCPVGALTSRDFRFNKRVWSLKPVPTIGRHSAMASPIWADVDQNRVWRFRPGPRKAGTTPSSCSTTSATATTAMTWTRPPGWRARSWAASRPPPSRWPRRSRTREPQRWWPRAPSAATPPRPWASWPRPMTCASAAGTASFPSSTRRSSPVPTASSTGAAWPSGATGSASWRNCWSGSFRRSAGGGAAARPRRLHRG